MTGGCRLVARPRLVEGLAARWERKVVSIAAGPGFGKSVLLAQAAAENTLAPRGVELLVECTAADRSPSHFLGRLSDAVHHGATPHHAAVLPERLLAEMSRRWPMGVCVAIDDIDHLTATAEGERLLSRLVIDAPASVHFVLAGRRAPRGLARLRAAGEVVDIGETDLALSRHELVAVARAHHADPATLGAAGGWPAATMVMATYGIVEADEYIWETVVDQLDDAERRVLAVAAAIGRCDAAMMRAANGVDAGIDPTDVLARIPLVGRAGNDEFVVHDLWHHLVAGELSDDDRRAAVGRAVDVLVDRNEHDRAFELCARHGIWEHAAGVVSATCRRGHAEVRPHVLGAWLAALPPARWDTPDGLLLRGLTARVTDPFGDGTADLLQRAAAAHRGIGDVAGEVAATTELAWVLRNQGRGDAVPELLVRVAELHAAGHPEVDGLVALGRSLLAEFAHDDEQVVVELEGIPDGSLSPDWQGVAAFQLAITHLTLGNEHEMVSAAERCVALAGATTARHVLALAQWYAGDPRPALAARNSIATDAGRSGIDAVALGSFATMVTATAGQVAEAQALLAQTERADTGPLSALMRGYVVGVRALVAAAAGDDGAARAILEEALTVAPITEPQGWRMASRWLALAYVLVPSTREVIDAHTLGPVHRRRVAIARAVVAAREGQATIVHDDFDPQLIATAVPLAWAMQLAGRLAAEGEATGRDVAETLFGLYGSPAKEALRGAADHDDRHVAAGARRLLGALALAPHDQVRLEVLGSAKLLVGGLERGDVEWQRERVRSLLLYLVLHGPARREEIIDALWPDLDLDAADRNLRVTLTYLQRVLEPGRRKGEAPFFVRQVGATLALAGSPHLVVDADEFDDLLRRADDADRRGIPSVALELLEQAVGHWRGPPFADAAYEEWAQGAAHVLNGRFVRAAVRAAELNLGAGRTDAARRFAGRALTADEWCEPAHRVVIASALADGDRSAAARAIARCDGALATLGVTPGAETEMLRRRLHAPIGSRDLAIPA